MKRLLLLVLLCCAGLHGAASVDSLIRVLSTLPMDSSRYATLRALIASHVIRQPDSALVWAQEYERLAMAYGPAGQLVFARSKIGHALLVMGRHAQALPYFLGVLPAYERSGNEKELAFILGNIGEIHKKQRNWPKARDAFLRAHASFARSGSIMWMSGMSESIAQVYEGMGQPDSALVWYARTVETMEQVGAGEHAQEARAAQAGILLQRGEEGQALRLFRHALHLEENMSDDLVKCMALIEIGRTCAGAERYPEADSALHAALRIAEQRGLQTKLAEAWLALSTLNELKGDHRQALADLRQHVQWKDSVLNRQNSALIAEAQERFDSGRKDAELEAQRALLERRSIVLYATISGAVVVLAAALFLYRAYRTRKRMSEQLAERNTAVQGALEEKDLLLRELHHRVKNNMQTVGSLLRLQARGEQDEGTRLALHEAMMRVKSLALVHQDLYRDERLTSVRMDEYVAKLASGLLRSHGMEQRVELTMKVDAIRLEVDSAVPLGLILNELITNALKHAFPEESATASTHGALAISLTDAQEVLVLEVRDNGVGYAPVAVGEAKKALSGASILSTFAEALRAEWTIVNKDGTTVRFAVRNFTRA